MNPPILTPDPLAVSPEMVRMSAILPPHPLDHENVVKILLGQTASDALRAIAPHFLAIITQADGTAPIEAQGRLVLHCLPLSQELADDAFHVATGTHRAVRIKQPKP